jgi:hypothetical protein
MRHLALAVVFFAHAGLKRGFARSRRSGSSVLPSFAEAGALAPVIKRRAFRPGVRKGRGLRARCLGARSCSAGTKVLACRR